MQKWLSQESVEYVCFLQVELLAVLVSSVQSSGSTERKPRYTELELEADWVSCIFLSCQNWYLRKKEVGRETASYAADDQL